MNEEMSQRRMVMTILEGHVAHDKWVHLEQQYQTAADRLPPQMVQTFLLQSQSEPTLWRVMSIWHSREALEEYRRSVETPKGVLMFRAVEVEPLLMIFDVANALSTSQ